MAIKKSNAPLSPEEEAVRKQKWKAQTVNATLARIQKKKNKLSNNNNMSTESTSPSTGETGDKPAVQPDAPVTPAAEPPITPAASSQPSGEDVIMDVPDIRGITPFGAEPKIEDHVTNGLNKGSRSNTSPPRVEGEPSSDDNIEFDGDIGGKNISSEGPPKPPPDENGISSATEPLDGKPNDQQPGNPQGNTITETQAEKMFKDIVKNVNYGMRNYVGKWLGVKPEKVKEYARADQKIQDYIKERLDNYNDKNTEALVLNEEDIEMLKDPAVAVLQEEGVALTNKQLLMIAIIQVAMNKAEVVLRMILSKKQVYAEIKEIIANGVEEINQVKRQAEDILTEVKSREDAMTKKYAEMNELFNRMTKMNGELNKEKKPESSDASIEPSTEVEIPRRAAA